MPTEWLLLPSRSRLSYFCRWSYDLNLDLLLTLFHHPSFHLSTCDCFISYILLISSALAICGAFWTDVVATFWTGYTSNFPYRPNCFHPNSLVFSVLFSRTGYAALVKWRCRINRLSWLTSEQTMLEHARIIADFLCTSNLWCILNRCGCNLVDRLHLQFSLSS